MKAELIVNLTAGGGKPKRQLEFILKFLKENKLIFATSYTNHQKDAVALAKNASDNGVELIISVGGDGTINEIINGIMQSKNHPALGIIPLGWANDFIKSINIPSNAIEACKIILKGNTQKIDLGLINKQIYFANICGIGFDAEITHLANQMKDRHPDWHFLATFVYVFATIRKLLATFSYHLVKVKINQEEIKTKILFIATGNGKVYGGKFKITPNALVDDGLLDICLVKDLGRLKYLAIIPKAIKGTHEKVKGIHFYKTKEIIIQSEKPIMAQVSGEEIKEQKQFNITVLPKSLKLIVPNGNTVMSDE